MISWPPRRVFAFAHAGGSAASFAPLRRALGDEVTLVPMERPGHGRRFSEPLIASMADCVDDAVQQLIPQTGEPYCFLGHSMGAWVAYAVAINLVERGFCGPEVLVVSGNVAPPARPASHRLTDLPLDHFLREVSAFGHLPPVVLERQELRDVFVPPLVADYHIVDHFYVPEPIPVSCPIVVLSGGEDPLIAGRPHGWDQYTTHTAEQHIFAGGHFFLYENDDVPDALAAAVNAPVSCHATTVRSDHAPAHVR